MEKIFVDDSSRKLAYLQLFDAMTVSVWNKALVVHALLAIVRLVEFVQKCTSIGFETKPSCAKHIPEPDCYRRANRVTEYHCLWCVHECRVSRRRLTLELPLPS